MKKPSRGKFVPAAVMALAILGTAPAACAFDGADIADGTLSLNASAAISSDSGSLKISDKKAAFVQFALDAMPAGISAANIQKATLRLWVSSASGPGPVKASGAGDGSVAIDEHQLSAATAPAAVAALGVAMIDASAQYVSFDATAYVRSLTLSQASVPAFVISQATPANGVKVTFDSKENSLTGHVATLQVELANTGPAGPAGMNGLNGAPGPSGLTLSAAVNRDGVLQRGTNGVSAARLSTGEYVVDFPQDVSSGVYSAAIGTSSAGGTIPGFIMVSPHLNDRNGVDVSTFDQTGAYHDIPFHLIVAQP